jgi:hypothetical protein
MYPLLGDYFKKNKYTVLYEVPIGNLHPRKFDVVAINNKEIITTEAKLKNFERTMQQAITRLYYSDRVFVAFPKKYASYVDEKYYDDLIQVGIGLLAVDDDVSKVINAKKSRRINTARRKKLLYKIKEMKVGCGLI